MSQPAIQAVALAKRFGSVQALRDLDLEVQPGEAFGYLGPNGAGKTTTIRLLLDFIRPTSGRIEVLGGSGADPAVRRRIGYLPAELPVDRRWTAQDLIDFYGKLRGGVDIRTLGSGNAGGTNALRTQGKAFALWVMIIDIGKGIVATRLIASLPLQGLGLADAGDDLGGQGDDDHHRGDLEEPGDILEREVGLDVLCADG